MSQVRVRAYCHGLGDCTLVEVARPAGGKPYRMLIDCGIHTSAKGGSASIDRVVTDLFDVTSGDLDVVVLTHEHWDHISAFATADWSRFTIGEVWCAWTENPADRQAKALDRFKGEAIAALEMASVRLQARAGDSPGDAAMARGVAALMGFNMGLAGEKSRGARDAAVALAKGRVRYLEPGGAVKLPKGLGVTAYVLGPPRDEKLFRLRDSANSYGLAQSLNASFALADGTLDIDDDAGSPFDETEGVPLSLVGALPGGDRHAAFLRDRYTGAAIGLPKIAPGDTDLPGTDQQWRRIDGDWLGAAATLALQLDDRTNNTSLVLALSLGKDGDVLLFAADAQIGNWTSWPGVRFADGTTGPDLLARTRFYKVGHHGSANATMRDGGLEAMTHEDLEAFIPTDEAMAKKVGWGAIPAPGLLDRLAAKGKVTRSDEVDALFVDYRFG